MTHLVVPSRFNGPAKSGNGGWSSGALAEHVSGCPTDHADTWPTVEVTLMRPPPLDTELHVSEGEGITVLSEGRHRVAEARRVMREPDSVEAVPLAQAHAAEAAYTGLESHPFPTCFTCGPDRAEGDGLRLFPGSVGDGRVACTWTPHPSVAEDFHTYVDATPRASLPVTWAALDCVGGWCTDQGTTTRVLGRMATKVDTLPVVGEPHVVVGELRGEQGRKAFTASTLYDEAGRIVARAEHVWIAVDAAAFG